jgi:SOS-response transcriptional repressor LexA
MKKINKKELIVFKALKRFYATFKEMPSIRELQISTKELGLDLKSSRSIAIYLNRLEDAGLVRRNPETKIIEIINHSRKTFVDVPIYGSANCGVANIFADEYFQGTLKVSRNLLGYSTENIFAIQASGDSMNDYQLNGKNIENGDYVIVDSDYKPALGDVKIPVLAIIDGLATIKLLRYSEENKIVLLPQSKNKGFVPIYLSPEDDLIINGKVINVLKA